MMSRAGCGTDLTDRQWEHLGPLFRVVKRGVRPPIHGRRELLNGIFTHSPWTRLQTHVQLGSVFNFL
jgi:hypothetical protein